MNCALLALALVGRVVGQLNAGVPGSSAGNSAFGGSALCNKTFADANATGILTIDLNSENQPGSSLFGGSIANPVSWASTVYQQANDTGDEAVTELSLWFSPNGANLTNNFKLGFDMCYFWISDATINTLQRGQSDNGSCSQTLDSACVQDVNNLAQKVAIDLVANPSPGPNSNLTANSLPTVCSDMAKTMTQNFPKSCEVFFNGTQGFFGGPPALGGALTGNQSLVDRAQCKVNGTYSIMWSQYGGWSLANYLISSYFVTPLVTVVMPIADSNRPSTLGYAKSFMNCLRANKVNAGSQQPPPAPSPTPIDTSVGPSSNSTSSGNSTASSAMASGSSSDEDGSALSGGAIAGIVVGVVVGVALLAALIIFLFFRRRLQAAHEKRKSGRIAEMDGAGEKGEMEGHGQPKTPTVEAPSDGGRRPSELVGSKQAWAELPGQERPGQAVNQNPAELDASNTGLRG